MKKYAFLLFLLLMTASQAMAQRTIQQLSSWEFSRDSVNWERVAIPHDWAISGPFDKKYDLQYVAIEQNGETEKTEKSGRSGALPWIGKGYYRTTVNVDTDFHYAELFFDGAMSEPVVRVNGKVAGQWAYGYNAFRIDVTPFLHQGDNTIEVSLSNVEESSRWYPGGGLYRPVKLIAYRSRGINARIVDWECFFQTLEADAQKAKVMVTTKVENCLGAKVEASLTDEQGDIVASGEMEKGEGGLCNVTFEVDHPQLWSPETPYLYTLTINTRSAIRQTDPTKRVYGIALTDSWTQKVGIRTLSFTKEKGFQLNGQTRKIKGVCLHHDLGPLGAAVNKAALIRQIKIMKDMGCDAIRTAHNMPSTMQMEVCDSMGMMVMAESFDMWIYPKCQNGYARFFKEWADRDIENLVRNHRNHPSIILWSIGNEIPEQWSDEGREIARHLQELCHRLDPTRMVTQGMDKADEALHSGFAQVMDVPGFNYRVHKYGNNIKQLPQGFLLGSETASTVSSRGVYKFPVTISDSNTYPDGQCSSYDTEYCSWSNLPDDDWRWQDDYPWVVGEFVWTGFDYLGEPTPYDEYWPARSSYFGICDLAGLPKDRYYLYRSRWNTNDHTIHLLPHWTWPGREGQVTPVYCYTDYPEGELFVNGVSQGRIKKNREGRLDRYRLRWNDVVYQPGEIRVVVYDEKGKRAGEQIIRTAGDPAQLTLTTDRANIKAGQNDLAFITVNLVDADGNLVPDADDQLLFEVSGAGRFKAACNGDATSLESFTQPTMRLFHGQLVVVVEALDTTGPITLTVRSLKRNISQTATLTAN
jgi:beta-galactosidase